jgi:hypothetical protein
MEMMHTFMYQTSSLLIGMFVNKKTKGEIIMSKTNFEPKVTIIENSYEKEERETHITTSELDDHYVIQTYQRKMITKLLKSSIAKITHKELLPSGAVIGLRAEVPLKAVTIRTSLSTKTMTDEQKEQAKLRMSNMRKKRIENDDISL